MIQRSSSSESVDAMSLYIDERQVKFTDTASGGASAMALLGGGGGEPC